MLAIPVGSAGAVSGSSISPTTLSSGGQQFEVTYSGGRTIYDGSNLVVEQCVADDRKSGFNPTSDCSSLSRQSFFGVPESGTITYGGNPATNPTAPFVGIDPVNGEWSLCDPDSGVMNHQSGYFRLSESPSEQSTDFFVPFTCAAAGARGDAQAGGSGALGGVALAAVAGAAIVGGIYGIARKRQRSTPSVSH